MLSNERSRRAQQQQRKLNQRNLCGKNRNKNIVYENACSPHTHGGERVREKTHGNKQTDTQIHMHDTSNEHTGRASTKYNSARQKTEDIKRQLNYKG